MISCMIRKWRSPLQAVTLLQRLWELPQQNNLLQKDMLLVIDDLLLSSIADIALGGFVTHLVTWILTSYMHLRFLLLFLVFLCLLLLLFQYGYYLLLVSSFFFSRFFLFFMYICFFVFFFLLLIHRCNHSKDKQKFRTVRAGKDRPPLRGGVWPMPMFSQHLLQFLNKCLPLTLLCHWH